MTSPLERLENEIGDGYALGPVRVVVGALLGIQALTSASELAQVGYFGDTFHQSVISGLLVPPLRMYAVLLAMRVVLAAMALFGVGARPALALSAFLGLWSLLSDRLQFDVASYALCLYAFLLSLTPCDRSWRVTDSAVIEPRVGPWWGVRLCQLQVSIVYLAAGGSKLLDPAWRSGVVLSERLAVLHLPLEATSALAKLAIMSELVICAALWPRATRTVALWWGVWFHVVMLYAARDYEFSLLTLVMYGVFATPDYEARKLRYDPTRFWGKTAGLLVPLFDFLGRFEVKPWEPDNTPGHSLVIVRRDGERVTGVRALSMVARALPVLFPFWAPIALVASFTRQGDLSSDS